MGSLQGSHAPCGGSGFRMLFGGGSATSVSGLFHNHLSLGREVENQCTRVVHHFNLDVTPRSLPLNFHPLKQLCGLPKTACGLGSVAFRTQERTTRGPRRCSCRPVVGFYSLPTEVKNPGLGVRKPKLRPRFYQSMTI